MRLLTSLFRVVLSGDVMLWDVHILYTFILSYISLFVWYMWYSTPLHSVGMHGRLWSTHTHSKSSLYQGSAWISECVLCNMNYLCKKWILIRRFACRLRTAELEKSGRSLMHACIVWHEMNFWVVVVNYNCLHEWFSTLLFLLCSPQPTFVNHYSQKHRPPSHCAALVTFKLN